MQHARVEYNLYELPPVVHHFETAFGATLVRGLLLEKRASPHSRMGYEDTGDRFYDSDMSTMRRSPGSTFVPEGTASR